ncbi:hypothetical protein OROHE_012776 [Orobanche hederae]
MSLRRSFLSRRIIHRSFGVSKSCQERSESLNLPSVCNYSYVLDGEGTREENDDDGAGYASGSLQRQPQHPPHGDLVLSGESGASSWAGMLPELLGEIMQRVEASEENWPQRQNVVACACVCKRWREATKEAVQKASINQPGKITFPSSLKKVGSVGYVVGLNAFERTGLLAMVGSVAKFSISGLECLLQ